MKDNRINYSELLYLHADKYVPTAGFLQNKEELPDDGKKLNVVKLGNMEAEVAFIYLYFNGHINLEIKTKKILGFIPKKIVISTKKSKGVGLTSLEKLIFDLCDGVEPSTILYRLIGEECSVPWAVVVGVAKKSLVEKKYLIEEKITKKIIVNYYVYKYHLNPKKSYDFKNELSEMNEKLNEFSKKDFYKQLVKGIDSGIASQKEKPNNDD